MTLFTYYIENRKINIYLYYCTFCQEIGCIMYQMYLAFRHGTHHTNNKPRIYFVHSVCIALNIIHAGYQIPSGSTSRCVCTAACGMGSMRQQLHLDHEEIMSLNIFTNIDNEQFLFRTCM